MVNVFGQAAKQVGGLAKHTLGKMMAEPMEMARTALGQTDKGGDTQENQAMEMMEQGGQTATQNSGQNTQGDTNKPQGFKTVQDFHKYQQLSGNKDQMELNILRKKLAQEWGVERGIEKAHQEYEQKEEERLKVEEQEKKQNEAMMFEKKKADDQQLTMAKNAASAEKRMAVAG